MSRKLIQNFKFQNFWYFLKKNCYIFFALELRQKQAI